MRGDGYDEPAHQAEVGDLLWNPKAGAGHVLVAEVLCGTEHNGRRVDCSCGGWGLRPCPATTMVCACGEDGASRDHHYVILARAAEREDDSADPQPAAEPEPAPVEVFASVRDYAVACARSVAMLEPTLIQQAIDEADRALTLGPILDPSLWQRGQAELEQQTRLLRALLHFRLRLEEFRPEMPR